MQKIPVQKLQNVCVTNNAVILQKLKPVQDSCVSDEVYKKYQNPRFLLKYFFPIFSCPKKNYILATDEWSKNYCHWLWEALSKVYLLKKDFPDAKLILQKSYQKIDFMMKSLEAFGFNKSNIKFIPKKSHLRVKNLAFIECINIGTPGYYDFLKFKEVSHALLSHYQNQLSADFGQRIYVSRNRPDKDVPRRVANESELVEMLEKHGFKTVYMEKLSFLDQISISSKCEFFIAPHGAGITNFMFSKPGSHLIELVNKNWGKTCFAEMCDKLPVNYSQIDCEEQLDETLGIHLKNIVVDIKTLEQKLLQILKK